ncbi:MAG: CPBP family intramembrane glutamic endopeptidase [Parvularculaceae bacterium]
MDGPSEEETGKGSAVIKDARAFWLTFIVGSLMVPIAIGLAAFLKVDLAVMLKGGIADAGYGVAATIPLLVFLAWFARTELGVMKRFRDSQIEFFSNIGFEFTNLRIVLLAIVAGVGEELLFRGALQGAAMRTMPLSLAIILPNIIFGILHARTLLYALIAALIGVWLGLVAHITAGLIAPIIAHGLYDLVAFDYTRRELRRWRAAQGES